VPSALFAEGLDDGVREAVEAAIEALEANGASVDRDIELPSAAAALPVYYIIAPSEASANLARYDGVKYGYSVTDGASVEDEMSRTRGGGFGTEVKRRIMLGTYALSAGYYDAYYLKAQKVRTLIRREFAEAFERVDVIATPTAPTAAFELGSKLDDPYAMYLNDLYTIPANIAGNPALSVPCGFDGGLPVGLQLVGRPFEESTILGAAHAYEQLTDWRHQLPPMAGGRSS
jgi:aspartyl-tRNA(Asn)/glutamyl-tRNA(Gln) amidotransferase subunit A